MARSRVPRRLAWAVEMLDVAPGDRILEIGCGSGMAVSLISERLAGGRIIAIDRSATAIKRATERNAEHVATGTASFRQTDLAGLTPAAMRFEHRMRFDKVFAVNVNLFWVRTATVELHIVKKLLRPRGSLHLFYEAPGSERAGRVAQAVAGHLTSQDFSVDIVASTPSLVCVNARLDPARH